MIGFEQHRATRWFDEKRREAWSLGGKTVTFQQKVFVDLVRMAIARNRA
jgi:hypothetical protein